MARDIDTEIRMALDAKAHEVDVPVDLARRTMEAAEASAKPSLRDRLRARTDAWRLRSSVTGYPRWAYAGAAAAMAVLLFVVGSVVRPGPVVSDRPVTMTGDVAEPGVAEGPVRDVDEAGQQRLPVRDVDEAGQQRLRGGSADLMLEDKAMGLESGGGGSGAQGSAAQTGAATTQIAPEPPIPPTRPGQFPPKIVRTANAEIQVRSFERAWDQANNIARKYRGYVTNAQSGLERGTVTMRVPADRLDDAMADLRKLGKLITMSTSAEDVSASIVDIDARIRVLEAEELQLLELLRKASGVSQTLEVRDRLNAVRQEIESHKAQKEYFTSQVDYSTINATLFERGADDPTEPGDGVLIEAWRSALRVGLTIVAGAVVVLGGLIPLVALALALWFGFRVIRRRRA